MTCFLTTFAITFMISYSMYVSSRRKNINRELGLRDGRLFPGATRGGKTVAEWAETKNGRNYLRSIRDDIRLGLWAPSTTAESHFAADLHEHFKSHL